jgi:23S rRNA (uracil1939-C5)-methyltransferase/tRNA (uracil-5-)-methyltransferase
MLLSSFSQVTPSNHIKPLCPVFGQCGGCLYQDIPYAQELMTKEENLKQLFREHVALKTDVFKLMVASPKEYFYRHRLDLKLVRTKSKDVFIGFSPEQGSRVVPVDECFIALPEVSQFIPQLKKDAVARLTEKYRLANLVVKTGDDGRVAWGGIGRRSLQMKEEEYLWTEVFGKKIFYSLDTFFQANLSILPLLIQYIQDFDFITAETEFYDLYGGVGLFGISVAEYVKKVVLIEECPASIRLAQHNRKFHSLNNFEICAGRVEDVLEAQRQKSVCPQKVAMIDPPRAGLTPAALSVLSGLTDFEYLIYLSCHPLTLVRDLKTFQDWNWEITSVTPFDFFPKTKHLETLVVLKKGM